MSTTRLRGLCCVTGVNALVAGNETDRQAPDGFGLNDDAKPGAVGMPGACGPWFRMEGAPHILWFHTQGSTSSCIWCDLGCLCAPSGGAPRLNSASPAIRYPWPRVMAKKTRKQKQRAAVRRPGPSVAPPTPTAPTGVAVEAEDVQPAAAVAPAASVAVDLGAPDPGRRRVERLSGVTPPPARARPGRVQPGYIQPLETDDAAIPFDRVPYVPADLRRVAIIAAVMIALIIVADIIVSNVVK
jgi:hypothetical protein